MTGTPTPAGTPTPPPPQPLRARLREMAAQKKKSPTKYTIPTRAELNACDKDIAMKAALNWEIRYMMFETATHETKHDVILAVCRTDDEPVSVNSPVYGWAWKECLNMKSLKHTTLDKAEEHVKEKIEENALLKTANYAATFAWFKSHFEENEEAFFAVFYYMHERLNIAKSSERGQKFCCWWYASLCTEAAEYLRANEAYRLTKRLAGEEEEDDDNARTTYLEAYDGIPIHEKMDLVTRSDFHTIAVGTKAAGAKSKKKKSAKVHARLDGVDFDM